MNNAIQDTRENGKKQKQHNVRMKKILINNNLEKYFQSACCNESGTIIGTTLSVYFRHSAFVTIRISTLRIFNIRTLHFGTPALRIFMQTRASAIHFIDIYDRHLTKCP